MFKLLGTVLDALCALASLGLIVAGGLYGMKFLQYNVASDGITSLLCFVLANGARGRDGYRR